MRLDMHYYSNGSKTIKPAACAVDIVFVQPDIDQRQGLSLQSGCQESAENSPSPKSRSSPVASLGLTRWMTLLSPLRDT